MTPWSAMEPGPALAWLLLLSLLADCLKAAQSRDFTVKDIIYLHPSTTPYPGGFKCFTCEKAADNYECNRWAPDIYCPRETRYCYTQHTMEVTGNSVSVTKRCVPLEECLSTGCRDSEHEGHKVCTSCCEGNICNLPIPRNETDATFATTSPINQTNGHSHCMSMIVSCLWVWLGLTL
ncbi:ly6/PLAUR domain-containing protein 6 isoform X1 [Oryctolagus cuniculus]|uniref:ly6/PLAUR domain-containing protein 6 isoform X1 n=1 Tax=Oryctolagus cuniculus TaxID=9986 RepID=UPI00222EBA38|nr:ly6/PLAUR domain-containing protein 6 isoform X3 [Oryctolagus cuniculus]